MDATQEDMQQERSQDEFMAMKNIVYLFGSLVIIGTSPLLIIPAAIIINWITTLLVDDYSSRMQLLEEHGFYALAVVMILLFIIGFVMILRFLPVDASKFRSSLLTISGLFLLIFPIVPLGGYVARGGIHGMVFGFQLELWYLLPLAGITTLALTKLMSTPRLDRISIASLSIGLVIIGILSLAAFVVAYSSWPVIDSSGENFPTPFSLLGLSSGILILSSTIAYALTQNDKENHLADD
ncbi:MAG: hypothetical protein E3J86_12700 [Candidatus Thorarchaeota archaeon]|nr:MAG: hypothetical protein E3J86_12700 [Candidatus Thorarchaeota archaeon]